MIWVDVEGRGRTKVIRFLRRMSVNLEEIKKIWGVVNKPTVETDQSRNRVWEYPWFLPIIAIPDAAGNWEIKIIFKEP